MEAKTRNSSFEWLRIIAMLCIVGSHASVHGGFTGEFTPQVVQKILLDTMSLGNLGVDIFVMITGFFSICSSYRPQKALRLELQVWTYSLLGLGCAFLFGWGISVKQIVASVFPTIFQQYWFFTTYIVLFLLTPYLNTALKALSKKQYHGMLFFLFLTCSLLYMVTGRMLLGGSLSEFIFMYAIGAYIQLYGGQIRNLRRVSIWAAWLAGAGMFMSVITLDLLGGVFSAHSTHFLMRTSPFLLCLSVAMLAIAATQNSKERPWVNQIAKLTFGIYLFHENPFLKTQIWEKWLVNNLYVDSPALVLRLAASIAIVFTAGALVEWLRQHTLERLTDRWIARNWESWVNRWQKILQKVKALWNRLEGQNAVQ